MSGKPVDASPPGSPRYYVNLRSTYWPKSLQGNLGGLRTFCPFLRAPRGHRCRTAPPQAAPRPVQCQGICGGKCPGKPGCPPPASPSACLTRSCHRGQGWAAGGTGEPGRSDSCCQPQARLGGQDAAALAGPIGPTGAPWAGPRDRGAIARRGARPAPIPCRSWRGTAPSGWMQMPARSTRWTGAPASTQTTEVVAAQVAWHVSWGRSMTYPITRGVRVACLPTSTCWPAPAS